MIVLIGASLEVFNREQYERLKLPIQSSDIRILAAELSSVSKRYANICRLRCAVIFNWCSPGHPMSDVSCL